MSDIVTREIRSPSPPPLETLETIVEEEEEEEE